VYRVLRGVRQRPLRSVDREGVGRNESERRHSPEIDRGGKRRPYLSMGKAVFRARHVSGREASGVRTAGMQPKDFMGTRRSIRFRRKPVGPDKPARRGRSEGLVEVRLADSTPRSGEPATWGSGQQKMNCSRETWALSKERSELLCKEKINQPWEQGLERIAAKARSEPKLRFTSLAHHITRE